MTSHVSKGDKAIADFEELLFKMLASAAYGGGAPSKKERALLRGSIKLIFMEHDARVASEEPE